MQNHMQAHAEMAETLTLATAALRRLASPIVFSTSLEGSVIEMKPTTLASQDTVVSLKA